MGPYNGAAMEGQGGDIVGLDAAAEGEVDGRRRGDLVSGDFVAHRRVIKRHHPGSRVHSWG